MRFSLLDRIVELKPGVSIAASKVLSPDEQYLKDHFPRFPVMPGVLMLECMYQASAWLIRQSEGFAHSAVLLKEARDTKDKIINEAKEQAKLEANKIITDAQSAIQQQKMAALTDVKNQVGQLVIEVSKKVLRRELSNKTDQETYIRQLTEEVKLN